MHNVISLNLYHFININCTMSSGCEIIYRTWKVHEKCIVELTKHTWSGKRYLWPFFKSENHLLLSTRIVKITILVCGIICGSWCFSQLEYLILWFDFKTKISAIFQYRPLNIEIVLVVYTLLIPFNYHYF